MNELTPDECRVLGVLVEKAHTTASQYPLSLNAVRVGCNQKSNRHPVTHYDEDRVVATLEHLRAKRLVLLSDSISSRVMKYKHNARETLGVGTSELVILAELLLRGPQTVGEIRTRASRMHRLGSLEDVQNLLRDMTAGDAPFLRHLPPAPGGRAERYGQLLCPNLHPLDEARAGSFDDPAPAPAAEAAAAAPDLAPRVEQLEGDVARLGRIVEHLARALGETEILE